MLTAVLCLHLGCVWATEKMGGEEQSVQKLSKLFFMYLAS